jgi:hypothetical protein
MRGCQIFDLVTVAMLQPSISASDSAAGMGNGDRND